MRGPNTSSPDAALHAVAELTTSEPAWSTPRYRLHEHGGCTRRDRVVSTRPEHAVHLLLQVRVPRADAPRVGRGDGRRRQAVPSLGDARVPGPDRAHRGAVLVLCMADQAGGRVPGPPRGLQLSSRGEHPLRPDRIRARGALDQLAPGGRDAQDALLLREGDHVLPCRRFAPRRMGRGAISDQVPARATGAVVVYRSPRMSRPLDGLERRFWLLGREVSVNVAATARVRGA